MCVLTNMAFWCDPAFRATLASGAFIVYSLGFIAWGTFRKQRI